MNDRPTGTKKNILRIDSGGWLAEIAVDAGANMFRLRHKASKLELLRSPSTQNELHLQPQMYGIPTLFPPNRIDGGKFIFAKQQYSLLVNEPECNNHLHGLILGQPWRLTHLDDDSVTMVYDFKATSGYPHDFTLTIVYLFTSEAVIQKFSVHNKSAQPMPFGLGFHTAFNMPSNAQVKITAGDGYWEIDNSRHLPTSKLLPWKKEDHTFKNDRAVSCHCPIATETIDKKPFRGAIIEYPDAHTRLYYEVDEQYRHWCLWNNGGNKDFFCPEPMTWMVNAPNLDLPPKTTGMQVLSPDSSWSAKTMIYVKNY
jgi:aldose 1-epimerase